MTMGELIQDRLNEKHMTQKDLAIQAGLTEASVSHYVRDKRVPQGKALQKIANTIDLTTDELLKGIPKDSNEEWIEIKELLSKHTGDWTTDQKLELIRILLENGTSQT